jgi:uncharacterized membrane protein
MDIQSPPAWLLEQLNGAGRTVGSAEPDEYWSRQAGISTEDNGAALPLRRIGIGDVLDALVQGNDDFRASRTDVVFLCFLYPILGFVLAWTASGYQLIPLLFPLASGFALVGPLAAVGLNEMSRRRELGNEVNWLDAFGVIRAPSIGAIAMLGTILVVAFLGWLAVANAIYLVTLGPEPPVSVAAFAHDLLHTKAGWAMAIIGLGVGFLFALLVLAISAVSFPLLLDRRVGLATAMRTSIRAVTTNPVPMAAWGMIVAAGLILGSIPLFLGLVIVLPVLGHATWHLYRKMVPPPR